MIKNLKFIVFRLLYQFISNISSDSAMNIAVVFQRYGRRTLIVFIMQHMQ